MEGFARPLDSPIDVSHAACAPTAYRPAVGFSIAHSFRLLPLPFSALKQCHGRSQHRHQGMRAALEESEEGAVSAKLPGTCTVELLDSAEKSCGKIGSKKCEGHRLTLRACVCVLVCACVCVCVCVCACVSGTSRDVSGTSLGRPEDVPR